MDHIRRCLSALTALADALLAVLIMPAGLSAAMHNPMPKVLTPSGDPLDTWCRGWPRAVAAWGHRWRWPAHFLSSTGQRRSQGVSL